MRRTILLTLLAALAASPTAEAAVRHVVRGAGFGHGIGMSQYGAYGYALAGAQYPGILAHYYTGTALSQAPTRPVRVLLQPVDPYIRVRGATGVGGTDLSSGTTYVARRSGSSVVVRTAGGKRVGSFSGSARFEGAGEPLRLLGPALNGISSGLYRGAIEVLPDGGGVTAINAIDLDDYVRGVVAGEMPSSWPLEALKVQAVAARTYALATRKTSGSFDQYPDTRSQVYRGVTGESVRSDAAVAQTAGRILTYNGAPAVTYYFSTSGGHTENIEYSFIGALSTPWLVGVPDPYDSRSPYHRWQATFSTATLTRALGAPGTFKRLEVLQRGASPRVVRARVVGSRGSTTITGPSIRARLGLRDSWLTIVSVSSSAKRVGSVRPTRTGAASRRTLVGEFWPGGARRALVGEFWPTPRKHRLRVERKVGKRWRLVSFVHTSRRGRYRAELERPGVYRVRGGSVAGPDVRLR
ncbi:MAG TPA: SpoIID/LytB domain-containing protein [Thermoleophilaceae bacterium]